MNIKSEKDYLQNEILFNLKINMVVNKDKKLICKL